MPALIDEPELRFTRRLIEDLGAQLPDQSPEQQHALWGYALKILQGFEREVVWPQEGALPPNVEQIYRSLVSVVLGTGERLLSRQLSDSDREAVEANVRYLRDKLVIEFSGATPEQSEKLLASIFVPAAVAA
jgi:hypothetical protein